MGQGGRGLIRQIISLVLMGKFQTQGVKVTFLRVAETAIKSLFAVLNETDSHIGPVVSLTGLTRK